MQYPELYAVAIPLIIAGIFKWKWRTRIVWWEIALPLIVAAVLIFGFKRGAEFVQSRDTEYLGGYVTSATYDEPWDEAVPCTHEVYRTEMHTYECGDGKTPQTCTEPVQVFDHYEHEYDVDDHPAKWQVTDSNAETWDVAEDNWQRLCDQFGNKTFVKLNRNFHSVDGNAYTTTWNVKDYDRMEPTVKTQSYENRVAASELIMKYPKVTPEQAKAQGLFEYLEPNGYYCPSVLPPGKWPGEDRLDKMNATLGRKSQVRVWLLVFQDAPLQKALLQEGYWKHGNKNELILCVGVDKNGFIQWQHVFSWCDDKTIEAESEAYLQSGKMLDVAALSEWLAPEIEAKWHRKHFKEFTHVTVPLTSDNLTLLFVLVLVFSFGLNIYALLNRHNTKEHKE